MQVLVGGLLHVRRDVIYDLQAEDEVDVVDDDERDELRHRDP